MKEDFTVKCEMIFLYVKGMIIYIILYIKGFGCGRVVQDAGRKAKGMVLQCINGVGSNPVEGRTKI